MTFEIQVLVWDRHKIVAGLNRLMCSSQFYIFSAVHRISYKKQELIYILECDLF